MYYDILLVQRLAHSALLAWRHRSTAGTGNAREAIVRDDEDRALFLECLGDVVIAKKPPIIVQHCVVMGSQKALLPANSSMNGKI